MENLGRLRDFFKKDPITKEEKTSVTLVKCIACGNESYHAIDNLRFCTFCGQVYRVKE